VRRLRSSKTKFNECGIKGRTICIPTPPPPPYYPVGRDYANQYSPYYAILLLVVFGKMVKKRDEAREDHLDWCFVTL
jgi:hypothetical protein